MLQKKHGGMEYLLQYYKNKSKIKKQVFCKNPTLTNIMERHFCCNITKTKLIYRFFGKNPTLTNIMFFIWNNIIFI